MWVTMGAIILWAVALSGFILSSLHDMVKHPYTPAAYWPRMLPMVGEIAREKKQTGGRNGRSSEGLPGDGGERKIAEEDIAATKARAAVRVL